jgi:hypothetical protein
LVTEEGHAVKQRPSVCFGSRVTSKSRGEAFVHASQLQKEKLDMVPIRIAAAVLCGLRIHPTKIFLNKGGHMRRETSGAAADVGYVLSDAVGS